MPAPRYRSRTFRRVFVKTPSKTKITYRKRKPSKAKCGLCGTVLKGVTHVRAYKLKSLPKTKKAPSRPYSNLCSRCSRKKLKERAEQIK